MGKKSRNRIMEQALWRIGYALDWLGVGEMCKECLDKSGVREARLIARVALRDSESKLWDKRDSSLHKERP